MQPLVQLVSCAKWVQSRSFLHLDKWLAELRENTDTRRCASPSVRPPSCTIYALLVSNSYAQSAFLDPCDAGLFQAAALCINFHLARSSACPRTARSSNLDAPGSTPRSVSSSFFVTRRWPAARPVMLALGCNALYVWVVASPSLFDLLIGGSAAFLVWKALEAAHRGGELRVTHTGRGLSQ